MNFYINSILNSKAFRYFAIVSVITLLIFALIGIKKTFFGDDVSILNQKIYEQQKDIDEKKVIINKAKGVLEDTLKELEQSKQEAAQEKAKREKAEKVFADSKLNAEEKRREYEKIKNNPVVTPINPDAELSDICRRAKLFGIECKE